MTTTPQAFGRISRATPASVRAPVAAATSSWTDARVFTGTAQTQVLPDPSGDDTWCLEGEIDLRGERDPEAPLVRLVGIHE